MAKTNRRGGVGGRSAAPTGAAVPAISTAPQGKDYALFVRQRKDDAAQAIRIRREHCVARAQQIADLQVRRAYERSLADQERAIDDFWRRFFRKLPRQRSRTAEPNRVERRALEAVAARELARVSRKLAAYSGPVIDAAGRRGVYLAVRYLSAKSGSHGCARRLVYYVVAPGSVEHGIDGAPLAVSNMGETATEMASAFALMEDLNRAARANAKVVFHVIMQLPHDVTPEQRLQILRTWCDVEFGARDLPYVAAVHTPSADGDQRNYHGHVAFSFRPMVRVAPFTWDAGRELRAELDNPNAFRVMRQDYATVMTAVCQVAGKDREYTALSNAARGLKHKPLEKLGPANARLARNGEHVPADARNRRLIARNEAIAEADRLKRRKRRLERRLAGVRGVAARMVRTPATRAPVPADNSAVPVRIASPRMRLDLFPPLPIAPGTPVGRRAAVLPVAALVPAPVTVPAAGQAQPSRVARPIDRAAISTTPGRRQLVQPITSRQEPAVQAPASVAVPAPAKTRSADAPAPILTPTRTIAAVEPISPARVRPPAASRRMRASHTPALLVTRAVARSASDQAAATQTVAVPTPMHSAGRKTIEGLPLRETIGAETLRRRSTDDRDVGLIKVLDKQQHSSIAQPRIKALITASRPTPTIIGALALDLEPSARLTAARKARQRARAAEQRRARDAQAASEAAALRQAAAAEAERLVLEALRELDPLVQEFRRQGLSVPDEVLVTLGRDQTWERSAPVQRVLAEMLDDQNERIGRLEDARDGTPPVTIVDGRAVPAAHLAPDLKRSVERWSDDRAFRMLVAHLWPAPAREPGAMADERNSMRGNAGMPARPASSGSAQPDDGSAANVVRQAQPSEAVEQHDPTPAAARTDPPPPSPAPSPDRSGAQRPRPRDPFDQGRGG